MCFRSFSLLSLVMLNSYKLSVLLKKKTAEHAEKLKPGAVRHFASRFLLKLFDLQRGWHFFFFLHQTENRFRYILSDFFNFLSFPATSLCSPPPLTWFERESCPASSDPRPFFNLSPPFLLPLTSRSAPKSSRSLPWPFSSRFVSASPSSPPQPPPSSSSPLADAWFTAC